MKRFAILLSLLCYAFVLQAQKHNKPAAEAVPFGQEIRVPLGVGLWGIPLPVDYDDDGLNDLLMACPDTPYKGIYWFRNVGTNAAPLFDKAVKLCEKAPSNLRVSYSGGRPRVIVAGTEYPDFFRTFLDNPVKIDYEGAVIGEGVKKWRSSMWNIVDWDGDGDEDLIVGFDSWDDYGWDNAFDEQGKWKNGPLHGWVYFIENVAGSYVNRGPLQAGGAIIDTYGAPCPCVADFDGDGEEDLVTGNTAGEIAVIRNLGGGKAWAAPELFTVKGKPWRIMAGENGSIQGPAERKWGYTVLSVADWDGDGRPDILFNSIWGKVEWMRGLGGLKLAAPKPVEVAWEGPSPKPEWNWWNPAPGTLVTQWRTTPVAIDWNRDGLCDLIVLDSEGYLAYFERLKDGRVAPGKRIFTCTNGCLYDNRRGIVDKTPGILRLNALRGGQSGRRKICFADWNRDGFMDLIVDGRYGATLFLGGKTRQDGLYPLTHAGALSSTKLEGHTTSPTAVDWDRDGVSDILVGAEDGHFYILRNTLFPL